MVFFIYQHHFKDYVDYVDLYVNEVINHNVNKEKNIEENDRVLVLVSNDLLDVVIGYVIIKGDYYSNNRNLN